MSGPRHLWSGDWREDSAAAAAERAARTTPPAREDPTRVPPPRPAPARPSPARLGRSRPATTPRTRPTARGLSRPRRGLVVAGALFLLAAAVAFGLTSVLTDSHGNPPARSGTIHASTASGSARAGRAWLGVDLAGFSAGNGALVGDVVPGSPADRAGLQPGDVISRIGTQPVSQPVDVDTAVARLNPGSKVQIVFLRGANTYKTTVTLAKAPAGYP